MFHGSGEQSPQEWKEWGWGLAHEVLLQEFPGQKGLLEAEFKVFYFMLLREEGKRGVWALRESSHFPGEEKESILWGQQVKIGQHLVPCKVGWF